MKLDRWGRTASTVFKSYDFFAGVAAGLMVGLVAEFGRHVQDDAVTILVTFGLLGAALLAVVLAALAILVTFFDDHFRRVIEGTAGGVREAMLSYKIVALIGGVGAAIAMIGAIVWSSLPHWLGACTLGMVTLLTVWAIVGTYQLVTLTIYFGEKRSALLEGIAEAKSILERRQRERKSA